MTKNKNVEAYSIGTEIKLADDVFAKIVSLNIRGDNHITYECGWWNGRSYDTKWFHSSEFEVISDGRTRIGFA